MPASRVPDKHACGLEHQKQQEELTLVAQTKPFNLRETKVIRDLLPEDINQLVSVSGMVTRCSNVIPEMQCAHPALSVCGG